MTGQPEKPNKEDTRGKRRLGNIALLVLSAGIGYAIFRDFEAGVQLLESCITPVFLLAGGMYGLDGAFNQGPWKGK